MKTEKIVKLPTGKSNIPYIKCKPGYAEGVLRPKRVKKPKVESLFNPPTLCISFKKAA